MNILTSVLLISVFNVCVYGDINMQMPGGRPEKDDTYLCTSHDVSGTEKYITGFQPNADMKHAHHMLLYGCGKPGSKSAIWKCGEMQENNDSPCGESSSIIFAWAMEGKPLQLPKDTAFKVGKNSKIHFLVLQIHYKNVNSIGKDGDKSGLVLKTQDTPTTKVAGVYLFATDGRIPAESRVYLDVACSYNGDAVMHPFAFRVHTHKLGKVVSGYKITDNGDFQEIGRKDPQKPQLFYPAEDSNIEISNGDRLAARCVMENNGDKTVKIGSTRNDEMCNFYMMYWVDAAHASQTTNKENNMCTSAGWPTYKWDFDFDSDKLPISSIQIPGSGDILNEFVEAEKEMSNFEDDMLREQEQFDNMIREPEEEEFELPVF